MLGKLLKHEFRATGRIMLPVFAALVLVAALANLSIRLLDRGSIHNGFLNFVLIFITVIFGLSLFAIFLVTLVLMVVRFHRNLLGDEGYLMHTLPVSVHGLVWSKMLVSLVWFIATALILLLIGGITVMIQNGTSLAELLRMIDWNKFRLMLAGAGIRGGDLTLALIETAVFGLLSFFTLCLHFYAALAIGHIFNRDKIILSIVFFVAISFALSLLSTVLGIRIEVAVESVDSSALKQLRSVLLAAIGIETFYAALLYLTTAFCLRRRLNLS